MDLPIRALCEFLSYPIVLMSRTKMVRPDQLKVDVSGVLCASIQSNACHGYFQAAEGLQLLKLVLVGLPWHSD